MMLYTKNLPKAVFLHGTVLLALSIPGLTAENSTDQDIPDAIVKKVDASVVAIQHERAGGSGFIVSKDGYILSNGHVVRGANAEDPTEPAKSITVILSDERKFPAKVLGFCMNPDVAVLKIECETPLMPVEFSNSRDAQIGQKVFAVGTPYGLKRTFSGGILSNVDRTDLGTFTKVFQTDAAINPGNSGGPLFDREGKVLGLNTYASRGANNLGFTIPIHVAREVYKDILDNGRFIRADVPIFSCCELYDELRVALGVDSGILVDYVMEHSPAADAGLKAGDVIISQNGKKVSARNKSELKDYEWEFTILEPGTPVTWTVLRRDGDRRAKIEIKAVTEESEPMPDTGQFPGELKTEKYDALGLSFKRIVRLHRIFHSLQDDPGVLVAGVTKGSPAEEAELSNFDIITHVAGEAVDGVDSFRKALETRLQMNEKFIDLTIRRRQLSFETALAPYYDLEDSKIVVIVPPGAPRYLDLVLRELIAQGADITLASPSGQIDNDLRAGGKQVKLVDLKPEEIDILLLLDGEGATDYWENETVLELIRGVSKAEKMLAAIGASAITLVAAEPELLEKKMTTSKAHSGEAINRKANYTGSAVEKDSGMLTTTGFDQEAVCEFLKQL